MVSKKNAGIAGISISLITLVIAPGTIVMEAFPWPFGSSHVLSDLLFLIHFLPVLLYSWNILIPLCSPTAFLLPGMGSIV